jgi:methylase of polypeptide subunit release factors
MIVPMSESWMPIVDAAAARAVGAALADVGYTEDVVIDVLGDDAYGSGRELVPVQERRLPDTPLGHAIRLCFLAQPVARGAFAAADALAALGLAELRGDELVPRGRILHVEDLLVASDTYSCGEGDAPDYVATYTPTARQCACLTPRRRVARALDVGTGSGMQALLAAGHAEHVVATDVNPRALAFTALNAALNGLENVETRQGSLFEPVAGETFDLVTCNAPFVVSPESRFVYRDGGFNADELSERVVRGAIRHLADDGYATLLVSWVADSEDEPDERAHAWLDGSGCDAWILGLDGGDPLAHAAAWNDYLQHDPDRYGAALDEWTAYFAELGVGWITEGAILLHRRAGDRHHVRADPVDPETLDRAGDQIERVFAAHEVLAEGGLEAERVALAPSAELDGDVVRLDEGTHVEVEVTPAEAKLLALLDGGRHIDRSWTPLARELLEVGVLELR